VPPVDFTPYKMPRKPGAGEGARTLDPDFGKVEKLRKGQLHSLPAVAAVSHRRHSWGMPTRQPAETTPDLFSALPTVTAAGPSAVPKGKAGRDSLASQQRHFLPKDLAGALKWLDDVEIDALLAAVTTEAERRG
jgi:hypothetical protein